MSEQLERKLLDLAIEVIASTSPLVAAQMQKNNDFLRKMEAKGQFKSESLSERK